jgi:hypothetical protein
MIPKTVWRKTMILAAAVALPAGLIWGAIAVIGASENPPAWIHYATSLVGVATAALFVLAWVFFFFEKKP